MRAGPSGVAAIMVALVVMPVAGQRVSMRHSPERLHARAAVEPSGSIVGTARKSDDTPLPDAKLRLRNVANGRTAATTVSDRDGRFRFDTVETGPYVVELVDENSKVLAVGPLFSVSPGQMATTIVRLAAKGPWFTGFFTNAAAAAISAASSLGLTAVGSSGLPVSPQ